MLAGRIYEHERQPSPALVACYKLLKREGQHEQSYESEDLYWIPIGSRYHLERAPLWETNSPVESAEGWMGLRCSSGDCPTSRWMLRSKPVR